MRVRVRVCVCVCACEHKLLQKRMMTHYSTMPGEFSWLESDIEEGEPDEEIERERRWGSKVPVKEGGRVCAVYKGVALWKDE